MMSFPIENELKFQYLHADSDSESSSKHSFNISVYGFRNNVMR